MKEGFFEQHWSDKNDNPAGGVSSGKGVTISWQNGPLAVDGTRREPNGAFVETVLAMVAGRIEFYEKSRFACDYNKNALKFIYAALESLDARTKDREKRNVEGTHEK